MEFLIIGNGGREDALAWKLLNSQITTKVHMLPGSVRQHKNFQSYNIKINDHNKIIDLVKEKSIPIVIIGPEVALCNGLADDLRKNNIKVLGPSKEAAKIEGSKAFSKNIMQKYKIPTASFFETTDFKKAVDYIKTKNEFPIVIKADGIAAGKGVLIAENIETASDFLKEVLIEDIFSSGKKVIIEDFLVGNEFSLLAFVNKSGIFPMKVVRDYKKAFDNNEGLNTGGMGISTSLEDITEEDISFGLEKIIKPTIEGLSNEGIQYEGVIYAGLIKTRDGIFTIEFNARFGDPETEGLMTILKNDLGLLIKDVVEDKVVKLEYTNKVCIGVVIAKEGYPEKYTKGVLINWQDNLNYFNMGVSYDKNNQLISNGGRVLFAYELGSTLKEARKKIYEKLKYINLENQFFYRKDIGKEN